MDNEIKNCPFCGMCAKVEFIVTSDWHVTYIFVECIKCAASSDMYEYIDQAIEAWNRRV